MAPIRMKLVVVGDVSCGKTSLLSAIRKQQSPECDVPIVVENFAVSAKVGGKQVELTLVDTAGQEDYDGLRHLSYPGTDVILMCYSIGRTDTLKSIKSKWFGEVTRYCPRVPVIVVGNNKDMRDTQMTSISKEKGEKKAKKIGAFGFLECSAKTNEGVEELLQLAIRAAMTTQKKRRNK